MGDEYGRTEWRTDEAAATAEAVRRIEAAIASGATVLDFSDLIAMTRLPDELAKAQGVRTIFAGNARATGAAAYEYATRLLSDVSALADLTKLTSLHLSDTRISDLSALSGLAALTGLNLKQTPVFDLSALSGLSGLTELDLSQTRVPDLSVLSGLSRLTSLKLSYTQVSDLSALSGLVGLTSLDLMNTQVSDLSVLSGLVGLTWLNLSYTQASDLSVLSGLFRLTWLNLSNTLFSDVAVLSGLPGLGLLNLSNTQVTDLGPLMSVPLFASEQAKFLRYDNTPAANPQVDSRLDHLSRLPPDLCAIETVQYLKGTHPDFSEPKTVNGVENGSWLAARLAEASPVEVVLDGGLLQARNAGAPERLAPKELGLRVTALREQVAALLGESRAKQIPEDVARRFQRYAKALGHEEVTYLLLDGPIAALRGGVNDPYVTSALDGGFVESWRALVTMHDELRPLLLPPEEDNLPDLRDDVTAEVGIDLATQAEAALQEGVTGELVAGSVVEAMQAATEYFKAAKSATEKKQTWIRRGVAVLSAVVVGVLGIPVGIGTYAETALKVQEFLLTPAGQALVAALRPLWEAILRFFA
jgi:hypothetical protein